MNGFYAGPNVKKLVLHKRILSFFNACFMASILLLLSFQGSLLQLIFLMGNVFVYQFVPFIALHLSDGYLLLLLGAFLQHPYRLPILS